MKIPKKLHFGGLA